MQLFLEQRIFFLTFSSTKNFQEALIWASVNEKYLEAFETYCPQANFVEAFTDGHSLSFSVSEADGGLYVMGLGPHPFLPEEWTSTSLSRVSDFPQSSGGVHEVDWAFYSIDTHSFSSGEPALLIEENGEISAFLEVHAPSSSVTPGDPEVVFWTGIRSDSHELLSVAAVVRWRTEKFMFASIATHQNHRGKGLAQSLVASTLRTLHDREIAHIGLGVLSENHAAKRVYEKIGFSLIEEFSAYGR